MISETGYIWSPLPLTKPDLLRDGGPVDPGLNQAWHEDASPLEVPIPTPWARFETVGLHNPDLGGDLRVCPADWACVGQAG